jgi:transposase
VRPSPVLGSDETSARVAGRTWWQLVLLSSTAICHIIAESRAASVITAFLDSAQPGVWVADRYGGQLGYGSTRQMCMAHLLRDAQYAIDEGCGGFAPGFRLLLWAMAIGKRQGGLKDTILLQYHGQPERRLDRLLAGPVPDRPASRRLFRSMRRDRDDLFGFVTRRDVPCINNACERALRLSVIFRKVTGGLRAEWAPESMPQPQPSSQPDGSKA